MTAPIYGHYRTPFSNATPASFTFAPGLTLGEMVALAQLPPDFAEHGVVCIAGVPFDRRYWRSIKPKPGHRVTFHYWPFRGGGDRGGGKAVLGIVLAVATVLTAGAASAGFFATAGGLFAQGSLSATLLAGGISLVGSLAASALSAPPASAMDDGGGAAQQRGPASLSGNVLQAGAAIPRVIGTRWIYPPLACQPLIVRDGLDEYAEGVFVLAGPHDLDEIRIGDAPVDEAEDVEIQTREGWTGDDPISLVYRYGATNDVRLELSSHQVDSEDYRTLSKTGNPEQCLPKWHTFGSSAGGDEIWLHFSMPGGLFNQTDDDQRQGLPFRVRMKNQATGLTYNLPELHYASTSISELKPTLKLIWGNAPAIPTVPANEGFVAAYKHVPGQGSPSTDDWTADSSFSAGSGNDGLYNGVEGSTNVQRVTLSDHEAVFYLDETAIPKGQYQVEVKRGLTYRTGDFDKASYEYDEDVWDFFSYYVDGGVPKMIRAKKNISDRFFLLRLITVYNEHPINGGNPGSGLATIAVRALNRDVPNLSVKASGYVKDWDGTGWNDWVHGGQYLAAHYRDILRGSLTPDPIDEDMIDEDSLLDWRDDCIANSYTCDLICEGAGIDEVLTKLAGCGYARPRYSEVWGVVRDFDRSGDEPVQIFTSRNSAGLSMAKAFARVPDAFRITYKSADDLDQSQEIIVYRPGSESVSNPRIEAVEYEGLTTEAAVIARARYDLQQAVSRSAFWTFKAPVEAIQNTRGDLIGINHDVIDKTHASARIIDVYVEGGEVTGVELDSVVPLYNEPAWEDITDFEDVESVEDIGLASAISIRQSDGTESQHLVDGATGSRSTVMFETPVAIEADPEDGDPVIRYDNLVKVGQPGRIAMRLVVADVTYDKDYFASVTAVAEAPELFPIAA